ncbi:MAG: hypothetical protein J0652_05915 [Desulfobulbaceae bacterium]|nr:hypothetical protein [Desulfobulbaceae bacterium]
MRVYVIFMMALGFFSIPPSLVMARELVYTPLPIENQATVVGSHAPIIQSLAEKLGVTICIRYEKDNNRTLKVLQETPPFPGFVIAGNTITMEPAQLERISSILMQTSPAERADWKTGRNGFLPVSDTDLDQFVRSMDGGL